MSRIKTFTEHTQKTNEGGPERSDYLHNIEIVQKGDKKAADAAREEVGDGKEPNHFFVTASNDYFYFNKDNEMTSYSENPKQAPVKIEERIEVETFGPFDSLKDAMKKVDELDLSETAGPRHVYIEDRKTGQIYEKFLKAQQKIVWGEEVNDETKQFGYRK